MSGYPRVLLFDIGGVCVVSPFQAILDYEQSQGIPVGYINHAISNSGPNGAWSQLERGDILLDDDFFRLFKADLSNEKRWRDYHARSIATTTTTTTRNLSTPHAAAAAAEHEAAAAAAHQTPPVPDIDVEWLYWRMMEIARQPDPHMWPALQKLRRAADAHPGHLILAALSNTSIFPPGHRFNDTSSPEGRQHEQLKNIFDVFVSSAHVGLRKPDEAIYRYALVRLHEYVKLRGWGRGVRPRDVTFLDDIGANLRTARALGMETVKVRLGRADLAVRELERITGLSLLEADHAKL